MRAGVLVLVSGLLFLLARDALVMQAGAPLPGTAKRSRAGISLGP